MGCTDSKCKQNQPVHQQRPLSKKPKEQRTPPPPPPRPRPRPPPAHPHPTPTAPRVSHIAEVRQDSTYARVQDWRTQVAKASTPPPAPAPSARAPPKRTSRLVKDSSVSPPPLEDPVYEAAPTASVQSMASTGTEPPPRDPNRPLTPNPAARLSDGVMTLGTASSESTDRQPQDIDGSDSVSTVSFSESKSSTSSPPNPTGSPEGEPNGSPSTFFSDVGEQIDSVVDVMSSHFEKYWPYYLAFLICLIIVSLMICYKKQLRGLWKSMGKEKQSVSQSAQEQSPGVHQDPPMGLDIV